MRYNNRYILRDSKKYKIIEPEIKLKLIRDFAYALCRRHKKAYIQTLLSKNIVLCENGSYKLLSFASHCSHLSIASNTHIFKILL